VIAGRGEKLRRLASRLLLCGFDGKSAPPSLTRLLGQGAAGAILFSRNVESPEQVAELCNEIHGLGAPGDSAPLCCVDQEGGRVARLKAPFTEWPPMRSIGCAGSSRLAEAVGEAIAAELRAVGIDLDFAPVLDVDTNPRSPVIGDRAFSSAAAAVAELGAALIRGLGRGGVIACGKHFPGHGDAAADSHRELPTVALPAERLREVELLPFCRAIAEGVPALMTAHVVYPALDAAAPATLSRRILGDLLRRELGFGGAIVSDDLEMQALAGLGGFGAVACRAVEAGADLLLVCHSAAAQEEVIDGLAAFAERGGEPLLAGAAARAEALRAAKRRPLSVEASAVRSRIGTAAHGALAEQAGRGAGAAGADPTGGR